MASGAASCRAAVNTIRIDTRTLLFALVRPGLCESLETVSGQAVGWGM
jgi:hypothetical protein